MLDGGGPHTERASARLDLIGNCAIPIINSMHHLSVIKLKYYLRITMSHWNIQIAHALIIGGSDR